MASLLFVLGACPMDEGEGEGEDDGAGEEDSSARPVTDVVRGTVGRSPTVEISEGQDGLRILYIAALAECSLAAEFLGATAVDADFTNADNTVAFVVEDLPLGPVYLAAFMDDSGDADPMAAIPGPGDLVFAEGVGDGVLSCVEVEAGDEMVTILADASIPSG